MLYLTILGLSIALIGYLRSPIRHVVHAGSAKKPNWYDWLFSRSPFAGGIVDKDGKPLTFQDAFVGVARGHSGTQFGILNGSTFVGEIIHESDLSSLSAGQIVVVSDPSDGLDEGLCLRKLSNVGKTLEFVPNHDGSPFNPLPIESARARVTHVL
jgi:hypothetical protein